ncbi:MAG: flagellar motor switch protein FliN [Rickettsiales bacterium]|nr:flagellar motor switch protein FliN [Rickettsiales bacterium]
MAEEKNKEAVEQENKVQESDKAEEVNSENAENNERTGLENLRVLENIDVKLTVEVGGAEIKLRELLRINEGSVIELERLAGDPLDILANGTIIAKGEVVMIGERFGIRFTEVVDPKERVQNL